MVPFLRHSVYVSRVHTGVNAVEINTEAASGDITEYPPPDDKPCASMFGFSIHVAILCAFISSFHMYSVSQKK